jgi:hypothetical protein
MLMYILTARVEHVCVEKNSSGVFTALSALLDCRYRIDDENLIERSVLHAQGNHMKCSAMKERIKHKKDTQKQILK